jgi:hypothetical protein
VELRGRESRPVILPKCDFHVSFRDLLHAANLRHGTDGFTSPPKEGVLRIFSPLKIRWLRPGLNPWPWVLKASTLPLEHRSRYWGLNSNYCPGQKGFDFTVPLTGCLVPSADLVQSLWLTLPIGLPWDSIFLLLALISQSSGVSSSLLHNLRAVSCQTHIVEVRVWSQASPCWNAVDRAAVKQVPLQVFLFSPVSIIAPLFQAHILFICHQCHKILATESMLSKTLIQPTHFPTWVSATLKTFPRNSITHLSDYHKMEGHSPKKPPVSQPSKGSVSKKFPSQTFTYINAHLNHTTSPTQHPYSSLS